MLVRNQKDFYAGLMFTAVGAAFALGAREYSVGTAARMGPGYFPLVLGGLLAILGFVITLRSLGKRREDEALVGAIAWKPLLFIIGANLVFGILLGGLPSIGLPPMGFVLAIVALVLLAAFAGPDFNLREAVVVALVLAVGSWVIFVELLDMPFQLWPAFVTG